MRQEQEKETVAERHPLQPFLPEGARLLMLGSFPPPRKRWSMDFFYPNLQNDMWRIFGLIFKEDKLAFVDATEKRFRQEAIEELLREKGIALYDTATAVKRLQGNASDKFLEVVEPTDVAELLRQLPECLAVAVTGQKAVDTLRSQLDAREPAVGNFEIFRLDGRLLRLYRMPSSSRAYPMKLERKAEIYRKMFAALGMLP